VIDIGVLSGWLSLFWIASWIFCSYSLVRSSFLSCRSVGQNFSSRIFYFSDGSVVRSPFGFVIGAVVCWVVDGLFDICLANLQKAVVFFSIDAMWLLHAWFFAAMIVLFLIASNLLRLFLSDGRRMERHNL
jgi:hypothetical protein